MRIFICDIPQLFNHVRAELHNVITHPYAWPRRRSLLNYSCPKALANFFTVGYYSWKDRRNGHLLINDNLLATDQRV
jgi:hypothetical protein